MIFQNITFYNKRFYFNLNNITENQPNQNQTISVHFEIHPLNRALAYLIIYQFNQYNNQIDGSTLFCPSNLSNESLYTYYIDNEQTSNHELFIVQIIQ
ncbi:unnamed protein product [Rotaria sp. Silwood1]|nr:unnamed protein product [Rotaria sp. Silwood1]CAF1193879.1 unnamed protein product [Rotaria sp. Silwood1]CAF1197434.1 unnamed protein product [Rotaria sp. Silwood1]CAF3454078.1 unnamed protein product [Rotaria sp. Silwood1]CAF3467814.1 unnamed protein product [Rotaria sp. Silwood1]